MRIILLLALVVTPLQFTIAQVSTNFNNSEVITARGKFQKDFRAKAPFVIPSRDIKALLDKEALENNTDEAKPFKIAEALPVDIDVVQEAVWVEASGYSHGKFSIIAAGAKSISANFDQFKLPKGSELYVYSENGEMITGPVTDKENNENNFWGSWVYKGGVLTIEFKTPTTSLADLKLHISSVAYGYKDIYVSNFGASSPCNINVLCTSANGWENERNSVALILDGSSSALCSGALINNASNLDIPYFLTANHCFDGNTANWKFTFQAWSATCTPSQNATGTTFNGSTLKARNASSDFCLLELNSPPPANSCIIAAGWSRSNTASSSGTSITHPRGDVMKIAFYNTTITKQTFLGSSDWRVVWANGTVEPGSSGGPLFNSDKRIIGQVHGGNPSDICTTSDKAFFGRFDVSWTGGGTNSTRLSNWLDPNNTGVTTTNARPAGLTGFPEIVGASIICSTQTYQVSNLPPGSTVTWSSTWNGAPYPTLIQNSPAANQCTINNTYQYPSTTTLTATINGPCGTRALTKQIMSESNTQVQYGTYYQEACTFYNTYNPSSSGSLPNTINTPLYLRQGCLTTITLSSMVGKSVTYTGAVQPLYWYYNSSEYKLYLQLPYMSGGIPFTFKITGQGACYEKSLLFFSYSQPYYPSYSFSVSPNPVSNDYLTISATPSEELILEKGLEFVSSDLEYAVSIIDLATGEIVSKGIKFKGSLEERLDISKLRRGLYSLQIFWKDDTQNIRFLKE